MVGLLDFSGGNLSNVWDFRVHGPWDDSGSKTLEVCFRGLRYIAIYHYYIQMSIIHWICLKQHSILDLETTPMLDSPFHDS